MLSSVLQNYACSLIIFILPLVTLDGYTLLDVVASVVAGDQPIIDAQLSLVSAMTYNILGSLMWLFMCPTCRANIVCVIANIL